jgi:hypothetical protein
MTELPQLLGTRSWCVLVLNRENGGWGRMGSCYYGEGRGGIAVVSCWWW